MIGRNILKVGIGLLICAGLAGLVLPVCADNPEGLYEQAANYTFGESRRPLAILEKESAATGKAIDTADIAHELSWRKTDDSVALLNHGKTVWRLNHDKTEGKPYFHPIRTMDGKILTCLRPKDHPWHRGLWFSFKYINGVNYWEEDVNSGLSKGRTDLIDIETTTNPDYSASIEMRLDYHLPDKTAVLSEMRHLKFSAPSKEGDYRIDWTSVFTAEKDVVLARTPIPGEPGGVGHGGYAGLSLRMTKETVGWQMTDSEGRRNESIHGKKAFWVDIRDNSGITIFSHPSNIRHPSPWYVNMNMPYVSPAFLFNADYELKKGQQIELKYRVLVHCGTSADDRIEREWEKFTEGLD